MADSHRFLWCAAYLLLTDNLDWSNLLGMDLPIDSFRKQITEAKKRLQQLEAQKSRIEREAEDLRDLIRANANFLPPEDRQIELILVSILRMPINITQAVQLVLLFASTEKRKLAPTEIREAAERRGFDFSGYSNPMASIHTILKRMRESGTVGFDEATGSYDLIGVPDAILDSNFEAKVKAKLWERMLKDENLKAVAAGILRDETMSLVQPKRGHTDEE